MGDAECGQPILGTIFWALFLSLLGTVIASRLQAAPTSVNSFEGPTTSWKIGDTDSAIEVRDHARVRRPVHSGLWSEKFHLFSSGGSFVYAATSIEKASVIEELSFSLWIRADCPGLQLAARVVLPRTRNPETGNALTLKIYGSAYHDVGRWEQVFLDQILHKVRRQARIAQSGQPQKIDVREAYIDKIMINLHGGRGETIAYIDDLTSRSLVTRKGDSRNLAEEPSKLLNITARLNKNSLASAKSPAIPRIIQYQGEPFVFLKNLGFNGIRLTKSPTSQQLLEASKYNLWLLAPPTQMKNRLSRASTERSTRGAFTWHQPRSHPATSEGLESNLIGINSENTSAINLSCAENIFTQISQNSEFSFPLQKNFDAINPPRVDLSYHEIREQVFRKITAQKPHFLFASRTPLNNLNAASRRRSKALRLILIELELLAPFLSRKLASQKIEGRHPDIRTTLLKTNHGSLVISKASGIYGTYINQPITDVQKITVPNAAATSRVFSLRPFDLRPVYRQRAAGGIEVEMPNTGQISTLFLTTHPSQIRQIAKHVAEIKEEAQSLFHWLLKEETRLHLTASQQLRKLGFVASELAPIQNITPIVHSKNKRSHSQEQNAYQLEKDLHDFQHLRSVQWELWNRVATNLGPPARQTALARFDTLPAAIAWTELFANAKIGSDLLAGSPLDLELNANARWNTVNSEKMELAKGFVVDRSLNSKGTRIHLWSHEKIIGEGRQTPLVVESPVLNLPAGQPYMLEAEVTVKSHEKSKISNVLIFDSGQGLPLGQPLHPSSDVQKCVLYRRSPVSGQFTISIMLNGAIEAWIENITVRELVNNDSPTEMKRDLILAKPQEP